ncbi:hypothetical protein HDV00_011273 [Rhizophlyctis rosea]|nr:hypothetical protein HDV00_011273 [Rhizophlyctis rosea]
MKSNPELFAQYGQQKGIIQARNLFLKESDIPEIGSHIVEEARRTTQEYKSGQATIKAEGEEEEEKLQQDLLEEERSRQRTDGVARVGQGNGGTNKVLILPIACIGAGKTTLGRILKNLYPSVEHIQSDNVLAKKRGAFEREVMNALEHCDVVIADKNNHMSMHRRDITRDFKWRYPDGKIVALDWQIERMNRDECVRIASERVLLRGENHQSLTPARTKDFQNVIWSFVTKRDPLDLRSDTDKLIDEIVPLNMTDPQSAHIPRVCRAVGWPEPTTEQFEVAHNAALAHKETVVKLVADNSARRGPAYYGVKVPTAFDIGAFLDGFFAGYPDEKEFWDKLVTDGRIDKHRSRGWHVTLCMNKPDFQPLVKQLEQVLAGGGAKANGGGGGGEESTAPVDLHLGEVVWDDRAMAITIKAMNPPLGCANRIPHITVATASDDIKPFVSNEVLAAAFGGRHGGNRTHRLRFSEGTVIHGSLKAFAH